MAKAHFESVDEYIACQSEAARPVLAGVRTAILKALPAAEEVISYGMPAYKLSGERVIYFAAWKKHYALYAATKSVLEAFKTELAGYEVDKGTIRFPFSEPVPVKLIRSIAIFRAKELASTR